MDFGLFLLRATIGLAMVGHGTQKLFGWFGGYGPDGTGQFLETLGFRPGRRHAIAAGLVETVAGLLLVIGLATPLGGALLASVMIVAAATVHWKNGFFATSGGYELNLILGVAGLALAFTGAGAWSVDGLLGYQAAGWTWGIAAAIVAVAGAFGQLSQRREAPHASSPASNASVEHSPAH